MTARTVSVAVPTWEPDSDHLAALTSSVAAQELPAEWSLQVVMTEDDDPHLGMVGNWNRAVRATEGELVLLLTQDDVLEPTMLATLVDALSRHPDAVVAACGRSFIDDNGNPTSGRTNVNDRSAIWTERDEYLVDHAELTKLILRNGLAYAEPSAMVFRRSAFEAIGGFDDRYEHNADLDFAIRVTTLGPAVYVRQRLMRRRLHDRQLTGTHLRSGATLRDREQLLTDHGRRLTDPERRAVHAALTTRAIRDAVRAALLWRAPDVAAENARSVARHLPRAGAALVPHLREIAAGENLDRR